MKHLCRHPHPILQTMILGCVCLVSACGNPKHNTSTASATAPAPVAPDVGAVANAAYDGVYDKPVQLKDGRYQGAPFVEDGASRPTVTLIDNVFVTGDLDGDGRQEAVALLAENSGGSGNRLYLAIVAIRSGIASNVATALVGDRVQVRSIAIDGNAVVLDVIQAGAEDAMCCPSEMARRRFEFDGTALREHGSESLGKFTLTNLEGSNWQLAKFDFDDAAPQEPPITLTFTRGKIGGKSACNRYFAAIAPGNAPGSVKIGPTGSTMMACPPEIMTLEDRYLKALPGVDRLGFVGGRLALGFSDEGARHTLLFDPTAPAD